MMKFPSWLWVALIIGNVIGVIFGFTYWYGAQLLANPWYLWLVIPVSPLYALLFLVALGLLVYEKRASFFYYLTAVGLVKYGLWTVVFWLIEGRSEVSMLMLVWLVGSHLVMAGEALLLVPFMRVRWEFVPVVMGWFVVNDYAHYVGGLLTTRVSIASAWVEMSVALVLTVVVPIFIAMMVRRNVYIVAVPRIKER